MIADLKFVRMLTVGMSHRTHGVFAQSLFERLRIRNLAWTLTASAVPTIEGVLALLPLWPDLDIVCLDDEIRVSEHEFTAQCEELAIELAIHLNEPCVYFHRRGLQYLRPIFLGCKLRIVEGAMEDVIEKRWEEGRLVPREFVGWTPKT